MFEKLEEIFIELGLPYSRQGSYEEADELPASFFTFWNMDTPEDGFYDNEAHQAVWFWAVYYYTKDPSSIFHKMQEFYIIAKEKGFIPDGRGKDIPSGLPDYSGRMLIIKYIEPYKEEK